MRLLSLCAFRHGFRRASRRARHALLIMPISLLACATAQADTTTTVDPSIQFDTFQGWGTSLAWWAHVIGGFPEAARRDYVEKTFDPVKGLGLNVVRYNIGGGENPEYQSGEQQTLSFRAAVPGYMTAPGTWDWNADANQRWVLEQSIRLGANQLEAFSNSPPWWMTESGSVTGNVEGADNLKPEFDDDFADYLTAVVKYFHDEQNITFRYLSPLNEPAANWWTFKTNTNRQEGAHIDRPHQIEIIKQVGKSLALKGMKYSSVTASDETSISDANQTFPFYDEQALAYITKINAHSYGGGDRTRLANFSNSAGKDLWLSEYGDGDASGLEMSRRILTDIKELNPTSWIYWQVVDSAGGWGFLRNRLQDFTTTDYVINKKYYVMAQYSRFIRPGFKFVALADPNSLAALDPVSNTLVIVSTNSGDTENRVTYDLSRFTQLGPAVSAYRTSQDEELQAQPALLLENKQFTATLPAKSVTTFVIVDAAYDGAPGFNYRAYYRLFNAGSGLVADVTNGSQADGAGLIEAADNGGLNQQWGLIGVGDGFYKIVNRNSGLSLDVNQAATIAGANIIQWPYNGGANQQWRLERVQNDVFRIINRNSGLLLAAGQEGLIQQTADGNATQQWRLAKVSP